MTIEQAKTLIPDESYVGFAKSEYRFAGLHELPGGAAMIGIYDEPPSEHVDLIGMDRVEFLTSEMIRNRDMKEIIKKVIIENLEVKQLASGDNSDTGICLTHTHEEYTQTDKDIESHASQLTDEIVRQLKEAGIIN
ncbi:MAG: hypothetical protein NXI20_17935 [bacterium]|nr:hypothetical protein [bacterium]